MPGYREGNMEDNRRLDKSEIPVCRILGVDIAAVDMKWLMEYTERHIKELSGDYMCVSNVHTTVTAYENEDYRKIQNGGIMAIPDGGPLASLGRKRGFSKMQRVAGPSYLEKVLEISVEKKYRHFFYGSTEETLEKLRAELLKRYPGIEISGMISPPFRNLTAEEDREMVERINASHSDFVWVGLGAPKQECWMAEHQGRIEGFMVGVGAGFDYLAGNIKRAPEWMQKHNLEWFYRLLQDPKRLLKRYFYTNTKFIWHACIRGR